jgi:energy-coupling factor transporter transmembrane protein EcfT
MANFAFSRICNPAKLYLVISVVLLVIAVFKRISALTMLVKGAFILLWTFVLNWLCSKGFGTLAWVIVLLPFLFLFLTVFTVMDLMGYKEGMTSGSMQVPPDATCPPGMSKCGQVEDLGNGLMQMCASPGKCDLSG